MFGLVRFVLSNTIYLDNVHCLMMKPDGGHRNSLTIQHSPVEFGLVKFVLTSTIDLDGIQSLMMLEGGQRNSLSIQYNVVVFGLVRFVSTSTTHLDGVQVLMMHPEVSHRIGHPELRNACLKRFLRLLVQSSAAYGRCFLVEIVTRKSVYTWMLPPCDFLLYTESLKARIWSKWKSTKINSTT